jgi:Fe/S biogenesis protein NfuA
MPMEAIVAITQTALDRVRSFRADQPAGHALWVRVSGSADGEYTCALTLAPRSSARKSDAIQHLDDLVIVVAGESIAKLRGATIDWNETRVGGGFKVINPNKPPAPIAALPALPIAQPGSGSGIPVRPPAATTPPQASLDSELAHRVMTVLDRDVNPNIAAHGGHAELAGIDGHTAYLRLGGGCQGCGMASVTLSQGIQIAITQAIPEILDVVDVTDHASGTNPYFEPAKK